MICDFSGPGIISSKTSEILGLWNRRYYRMIECLFEATQTAGGSPSVDERTRDGLVENACARVQVFNASRINAFRLFIGQRQRLQNKMVAISIDNYPR